MNRLVGHKRGFATFDQVTDSLADAIGIAKKLDAELVVFVPAHD